MVKGLGEGAIATREAVTIEASIITEEREGWQEIMSGEPWAQTEMCMMLCCCDGEVGDGS